MIPQPQKEKSYSDMLSVLGPLATFAGGLTIATQFIIQCPDSRLQVLLAIISELFLASLLGTVVMYLILYGLDDETPVRGCRRHYLIFQFGLVGIMMAAAFMLLAVALMVTVRGSHLVRIQGVVLIGILVAGAIGLGCMILHRRKKPNTRPGEQYRLSFQQLLIRCCIGDEEHQIPRGDGETADLNIGQMVLLWCLCVLEFVAILILLGWGGYHADKAPRLYGCSNGTTILFPSPLPTIPVSVVSEATAPWPQSTDIVETISEIDDVAIVIINIAEWESGPYRKTTRTPPLTKTAQPPPIYSSSSPLSTLFSSTLSSPALSSTTISSPIPSPPILPSSSSWTICSS